MPDSALVLVDIQRDFLSGGALAVPGGDEVIPVANRLQAVFDLVVATQDWHPENHVSFAINHPGRRCGDVIVVDGLRQVLWPVHCVADTPGADLAPQLATARIAHRIHKGVEAEIDSYSAFFDNAGLRSTGLGDYLIAAGVRSVFLLGLATEYCVAASARDALKLGFRVTLIKDGCRGLQPADIAAASADLCRRGADFATSESIISHRRQKGK